MYEISSLRNLVSNGWTIANRRGLQKVIGKNEFKKLGDAFNMLKTHSKDSFLRGDVIIPTGAITISKCDGEFLLILPTELSGICVNKPFQFFIGKDINLKTIIERVNKFQTNVINYFKNAKELTESAFESKTISKLYSSGFKAKRRINEDGYYVTTIIDKATEKPVEAYVKCISKSCDRKRQMEYEKWGIYVKNSHDEYELVGKRSFHIDRKNQKLLPDWMDSNDNLDRFAGIGLRAHQIGVERMIQEKLSTVQINALDSAFPFHYKSGFRILQQQVEVPKEGLERLIDKFAQEGGLDKEILKKAVVSNMVEGKLILDSQTLENFRKLSYLKNNGKVVCGDTPMELRGQWLEKWKQMAESQPILL